MKVQFEIKFMKGSAIAHKELVVISGTDMADVMDGVDEEAMNMGRHLVGSTNFHAQSIKKIKIMPEESHLEDSVLEKTASAEMIAGMGRERFNEVADAVAKIDSRVNDSTVSPPDSLDGYFPIDDAAGAIEYLLGYADWASDRYGTDWGLRKLIEGEDKV